VIVPSKTNMHQDKILIWLPSPMGDAILSTPALRAIREHFKSAKITFLADRVVRDVLSPSVFNDDWLEADTKNPFALTGKLEKHKFTHAILFKNSFGSALTVFLAGIKMRTGYVRDGRGILLTDKLYPPKMPNGKYRPQSMIDYYLAIASWLGAESNDRTLQINVTEKDKTELKTQLGEIFNTNAPVVVLVPGGAFGPSKYWPADRFAKTADWLSENHNAKVVVSVAPVKAEKKIAQQICSASKSKLINLAEKPLGIGQLKALFAVAQLVICNDTGPRHIATALGKKVITLYGPNDPVWTQTGYENEVQIIGRAPCAPCLKPNCDKPRHLCMESITVQRVCQAADRMLTGQSFAELSDQIYQYEEISKSSFMEKQYVSGFKQANLADIDAIFSFKAGRNLTKENLAEHRCRIKFQLPENPETFFLKRYLHPPLNVQLDKWICNHGPITCGLFEFKAAERLNAAGINTAKTIACGSQYNFIFERRSFIITEQIPNAVSLEQKLPSYFYQPITKDSLNKRRTFIKKLADFIKRFHATGFRHRDLYLCHIFCNDNENFTMIDLARTFKPILLPERFRVKDIAQLFYSAAGKYFSNADRLRFYKAYTGHKKLTNSDRNFIKSVINKASQMARHDRKHNRIVPYKDIN